MKDMSKGIAITVKIVLILLVIGVLYYLYGASVGGIPGISIAGKGGMLSQSFYYPCDMNNKSCECLNHSKYSINATGANTFLDIYLWINCDAAISSVTFERGANSTLRMVESGVPAQCASKCAIGKVILQGRYSPSELSFVRYIEYANQTIYR